MTVCAQTLVFCMCRQLYTIPACSQCSTAQHRDSVNILEARIADLEADNLALRRRVTELEHRCNDRQTAHNALVATVEKLQERS